MLWWTRLARRCVERGSLDEGRRANSRVRVPQVGFYFAVRRFRVVLGKAGAHRAYRSNLAARSTSTGP